MSNENTTYGGTQIGRKVQHLPNMLQSHPSPEGCNIQGVVCNGTLPSPLPADWCVI